jgi:hypothetical protein
MNTPGSLDSRVANTPGGSLDPPVVNTPGSSNSPVGNTLRSRIFDSPVMSILGSRLYSVLNTTGSLYSLAVYTGELTL